VSNPLQKAHRSDTEAALRLLDNVFQVAAQEEGAKSWLRTAVHGCLKFKGSCTGKANSLYYSLLIWQSLYSLLIWQQPLRLHANLYGPGTPHSVATLALMADMDQGERTADLGYLQDAKGMCNRLLEGHLTL
jgi:hypothetical protein